MATLKIYTTVWDHEIDLVGRKMCSNMDSGNKYTGRELKIFQNGVDSNHAVASKETNTKPSKK